MHTTCNRIHALEQFLFNFLSDKEKEGMKVDIAVSRAADFVYEHGVAVEKKEEEAPAEEAAEEKAE